jgi:hypothetical protein
MGPTRERQIRRTATVGGRAGGAREPAAQGGNPRRVTATGSWSTERSFEGWSRCGDPAAEPTPHRRGREVEEERRRAERRAGNAANPRVGSGWRHPRPERGGSRRGRERRRGRNGNGGAWQLHRRREHGAIRASGSGRARPSPCHRERGVRRDREIASVVDGGAERRSEPRGADRLQPQERRPRSTSSGSEIERPGGWRMALEGSRRSGGSSTSAGSDLRARRWSGAEHLEDPSTDTGSHNPDACGKVEEGAAKAERAATRRSEGRQTMANPSPTPRPRGSR